MVLEGLDHAMLILVTEMDHPKRKKRFMYNRQWNQDKQCAEVVRSYWGNTYGDVSGHNLVAQLNQVQHGLLGW